MNSRLATRVALNVERRLLRLLVRKMVFEDEMPLKLGEHLKAELALRTNGRRSECSSHECKRNSLREIAVGKLERMLERELGTHHLGFWHTVGCQSSGCALATGEEIVSEDRFKRPVVGVVAKRAGSHCSNPDCGALTSGPADDASKVINVGEAAHIFGAKPGSARFDPQMSDIERADITNAIWLCRNCHKMVDADHQQFPADLLFEWRRAHEQIVMERLGKAGALLRLKVSQRRLEEFQYCSYLAQQIVIDKPGGWEYRLTAELLRTFLEPIKLRWEALDGGLYAYPVTVISEGDYIVWQQAKLASLMAQINAIDGLFNKALEDSWGPPGQPGSESDILRVCTFIRDACQQILHWEEQVRFVYVPSAFKEVQELFIGIAGRNLVRVFEIPEWISSILDSDNPTGIHTKTLVFDMPEGWAEMCSAACSRAINSLR